MAATQAQTLEKEREVRSILEGGDAASFETNYLVEAGAGAGKSYTMTQRIANLLLAEKPACKPEQLVAITFTVKATQELQGKLEREFRKRLENAKAAEAAETDPKKKAAAAEETARLATLTEQVDQIQISTIDSFCRKLLTTMPFANPLGLSGSMESDESKLAKDFFASCRRKNADRFRELETHYRLKYDTLESVFLACCGKGDFLPFVPGKNDKALLEIEKATLPAAANRIRKEMNALLTRCPFLKDMLNPVLSELLARPDADFAQGQPGMDELIAFFRTHPTPVGADYSSLIPSKKWEACYRDYSELFAKLVGDKKAGVIGILESVMKSPKRLDIKACQVAKDRLVEQLLAPNADPRYADWVDPGLMALAKKLDGVTFTASKTVGECSELTEFREFFAAHKSGSSLKKLNLTTRFAENELRKIWLSAGGAESFEALLGQLLHRDVLNLLYPYVADYRAEKRQLTTATFNDVLVMARDMLRKPENKAVREYFRGRYRCFYVDEFQDTDAIQTELLFYLACEEADFHSGDWEKCKPRGGSLFLVGDPKQGIYRFRGADVSIYKRVKALFKTKDAAIKIGEFHELHFNFRSTKEICDFSRRTFMPPETSKDSEDSKDPPDSKKKQGFPLLVDSEYQAPYADMIAVRNGGRAQRTAEKLSRIFSYSAENTPEAVACFIEAMIRDGGVLLAPRENDPAPRAKPGDFLILTFEKKDANPYAQALRARDIPALLSGQELFSETAPIANAKRFLNYLLDPDDPVRLLNVLHNSYGVKYQDIRRAQKLAGVNSLHALFRRLDPSKPGKRLDALAAEIVKQPTDAALTALCAALEELWQLRIMTQSAPAMSVLERLFDSVGALWPKQGKKAERRVEYARVRQFLAQLRSERLRDFPSLARRALELAEEDAEDELPLEPGGGAVRIMNLHKAKGLESEIVILANCSGNGLREPKEYRESAGGKQTLHICVSEVTGRRNHKIGQEQNWAKFSAEETNYAVAERDRLLYVAVTRAKSMLLVNRSSYWNPIVLAADELEQEERKAKEEAAEKAKAEAKAKGVPLPADPKPALPPDDELRWQAARFSLEKGVLMKWEDLKATRLARIAEWEEAQKAKDGVTDRNDDAPDNTADADDAENTDDAGTNTSASPLPFSTADFAGRTAEVQTAVEELAASRFCVITPSRLDKSGPTAPKRLLRKDQENAEDQTDEPAESEETSPSVPKADAVIDDVDEAEASEQAGADDTGEKAGDVPRGRHWGTIIHRIMELAVKNRQYDADRIRVFARQAAYETLADAPLTPTERRYLCCGDAEGEALLKTVAEVAEQAAVFLSDENAPLRRLTEGGQCFTELQFFVRAEDRCSPLYQHLSANLRAEAAKDRTLDVNGIIDLAVRSNDGSWIVVDYKTDALWVGETKEHLEERLARHYWAQIAAYAKVLELQQGARVTRAYLCSIPLGGRLIELDLSQAPSSLDGQEKTSAVLGTMPVVPTTPAVASPAARAPAAARHSAASLMRGRGFAPELQSATDATAFVLVFQGQRLTLTDKHGQARDSFKMCRDFAGAVARWAEDRHPGADCTVDFTNAGSVTVLRRLLRMLHAALPNTEWESLEILWEPKK